MRYGDLLAVFINHASFPRPLKIDAFLRWWFFTVADPLGYTVFINQHIGPYDFGARISKTFHQFWVSLPVHIFHNTEYSNFGINGSNRAVIGNPHLCEVIAHKMVAGHGSGRFPATAGSRSYHPGNTPVFPLDPGDKHMFGRLLSLQFIHTTVYREAMVALFHQQCIAGIGAINTIRSQMAPIHEHPGVRQILRTVQSLTVNIGIEVTQFFNLLIKSRVYIAVQYVGAVHNISRAGHFNCWIRCRCTHRAAQIKPNHHYFALHNADHFFLYILKSFGAIFAESQRADLFTFIADIKGTINDAALLLLKIVVDGMFVHRQFFFFSLFEG